jgi:pyruvate/2-oxoglutarate/acetoin dehydrogenase E1 component
VIEEGSEGWSWGTEVSARISSEFFGRLRRPVATAASDATVIPSSKELEGDVLMNEARIEQAIRQVAP